MTHHAHHPSPQRGFSMIELLMAMVIFAIGLLGLAALQVVSLSQSGTGRQRGGATFIAHAVLDRIQAEGQTTAAERRINANGLPSTTAGWTFIGAADGTPAAGASALLFDINGVQIAPTDTTTPAVFSASWLSRQGAQDVGKGTALQEFVVNVTWQEMNPKTKTLTTKAISVSRYVRI